MAKRVSVEPLHPAIYIKRAMDARGWTQDDLADVMGKSRHTVLRLLNEKTAVTPDTAHALAQAFDTDADLWMNLQTSFELSLAAKEDRDVERRAAIYNKIPVRDVMKRHWIAETKDTSELEQSVCGFLRIPSIIDSPQFAMAARKSTDYGSDTPSQIAWYARAWQLAHAAPAARYSDTSLGSGLIELRKLARYREDVRQVPRLLADIGIRLILIERLPKSKVDGVAFWIHDKTSPAVALSLRYDRIDNFWHTLMHEIMHIKHRDDPMVDVDLSVSAAGSDVPEIEARANAEASEYLFPYDRRQSFIDRHNRICSQADIVVAAKTQKVHAGILVGQLHGHKAIDYSHHRKLLVPIRSEIVGQALTDGWGHAPKLSTELET